MKLITCIIIALVVSSSLPVYAVTVATVPFTTQAPMGNWANPTFQNGCEEAALIMAIHWVRGTPLAAKDASAELRKLSAYEVKYFGTAVDTSAADTTELMKKYYRHSAVSVRYDIAISDIIHELAQGHLVIVPANGRALRNPHFKRPGPETHMVLVKGYDPQKKEFITNDAGTRFGNGYRYKEDVFFAAIRDYPTGDHVRIKTQRTAMIVVAKK